MKYNVKRLKNLAVALKELEPHIRDGRKIKATPNSRVSSSGPANCSATG